MVFFEAIPIIGAVADVISGESANQANLEAVREANKGNMELAKYNWEQQKAMYEESLDYNRPLNQMRRFEEAGLNPNLIYGQGSSGNVSVSQPTPQMPTMQAAHFNDLRVGQAIRDAVSKSMAQSKLDSENNLRESQAAAQKAQSIKSNAETALIGMKNARGWQEYRQSEQMFGRTLQAADLNNILTQRNIEKRNEELKNFPIQRALMNTQIDLMRANTSLSYSQAKKNAQDIVESSQRIVKLAAETNNLRKLGRKLGIEANIAELTEGEQVRLVSEKLTEMQLRNSWNKQYGFSTDQVSNLAKTIGFDLGLDRPSVFDN